MNVFLGVDLDGVEEVRGLNLKDLAQLEKAINIVRLKIIQRHIDNGVVFRNTADVYVYDTVSIGSGTVIYGDQHIRGDTVIGKNCRLESGNIIENAVIGNEVVITKSIVKDCRIGNGTTVGPFAHIHTNSVIERKCRVGNFVEIKNATVGVNTKMAHLTYVGDVDIGNQCNIGCGSIFVNYDGMNKHRSVVGDSVFIGSNSNIIAPVKIEDNAYICAGTTVTTDLPKESMCIGRSRETIKENRSRYHKNVFNKKYFGTDGIRGVYGEDLTDEIAYMTGNFLGYSSDGGKVVVGRDTRISGEAISKVLIRGIADGGADVVDLGVTSTPSVAYVTTHAKANYGIVISASHNPAEFNGIKIFTYAGRKLTDVEEMEIESHIDGKTPVQADVPGEVSDGKSWTDSYYDHLAKVAGSLKKIKVVLDCSNGAVSSSAPALFKKLGAQVFSYNDAGDGSIINRDCGALHPEFAAGMVKKHKADVGFSFDGDADRVVAVNEKGEIVDGDSIIYVIARQLKKAGKLDGNKVVGTVMTNVGVEKSLNRLGITLLRTDVGDHRVMEEMFRNDVLVGGENSGHIILREFSNTGDGLLTALYLCRLMSGRKSVKPLSRMDNSVHYPQIRRDVHTTEKKTIASDERVRKFVDDLAAELDGKGRVLLRASGTEPKIRIMVECGDADAAARYADRIEKFIKESFPS